MHTWTDHPHLVAFDAPVDLGALPTAPPPGAGDRRSWKRHRARRVRRIGELQQVLWALDTHAVLCVFQGMDAAGKDGAIRKALARVAPAGCRVHAFQAPSDEELDHDFLWRLQARLPERGRIGVFNRSHYEEVLVARVHPELLDAQRLHSRSMRRDLWPRRFRSIRSWERHLADNGTVVLKFFLHLSKDEQRRRFLARVDRPHRHWKFDEADLAERAHWDAYQRAYEEALAATSRPWAPWYAVPADDKRYASMVVADVIATTLERLDLAWPALDPERRARLREMRAALMAEGG